MLRDPYQFSETVLILPPVFAMCLECFDGQKTDLDLRAMMVQITGEIDLRGADQHLTQALNDAGFLENEVFHTMREARMKEFAESPLRLPAHAGSGYPDETMELRAVLTEYLDPFASAEGKLRGIAAPHVSPFGGWECYGAAFGALTPELKDKTFVILGTSHYGAPERFGLTRKPFATPYGETRTELGLVDRLAALAPGSILMEDYCHAIEHSIEFQVIFLQHLYGPDVKILPILCGSYAKSIYEGGKPEDDEAVKRFLGELGDIAEREADRLFWVLGIDMAHIGARYGDQFEAVAEEGQMLAVGAQDKDRIERVTAADADGFWSLVQPNEDELRWCGSSPLYTYLKVCPKVKGELLRYQQWNIDPQSVVSFAGMAFR